MTVRTKHRSASQDRAIPGRPDAENRDPNDYYRTPRWATEALLDREPLRGRVWEPACGDGAMSIPMIERGYAVYSSDLIHRGYDQGCGGVDFLAPMGLRFVKPECVVTNPPFRLAQQFAERALEVASWKVCMIARTLWLEGIRRKPFFESSPLARVYIFSGRVDIARQDHQAKSTGHGGMTSFAWYVWEHGYEGHPELHWI